MFCVIQFDITFNEEYLGKQHARKGTETFIIEVMFFRRYADMFLSHKF